MYRASTRGPSVTWCNGCNETTIWNERFRYGSMASVLSLCNNSTSLYCFTFLHSSIILLSNVHALIANLLLLAIVCILIERQRQGWLRSYLSTVSIHFLDHNEYIKLCSLLFPQYFALFPRIFARLWNIQWQQYQWRQHCLYCDALSSSASEATSSFSFSFLFFKFLFLRDFFHSHF